MSKPLPLTMQGYLVGRDAAQEGDPRLLDDWAERALQAGGWAALAALARGFRMMYGLDEAHYPPLRAAEKALTERSDAERALQSGGWAHVEALLPYAQDLVDLAAEAAVNGDGPVFPPYTPGDRAHDAAVLQAAVKALTGRSDGMPQTLRDALVEGWACLRRSRESPTRAVWLFVDTGSAWRVWWLEYESSMLESFWYDLGDLPAEQGRFGTAAWRNISPHQRARLLEVWPAVYVWHESPDTVPAPWEPNGR